MGAGLGERDPVSIPSPKKSGARLTLLPVPRLSELLSLPLPTLPSLQSSLTASFVTSGSSAANAGAAEEMGPQSLWADEEEKRFYEDLRELRGEVPAVILGVKDEPKVEKPAEEAVAEGAETEDVVEGQRDAMDKVDAGDKQADGPEAEYVALPHTIPSGTDICRRRDPVAKLDAAEPDPSIPSGPAAQLTAIFARLPEASSKRSIDDIALEFALLNSKAARKRLVKVRFHDFVSGIDSLY